MIVNYSAALLTYLLINFVSTLYILTLVGYLVVILMIYFDKLKN